MLTVEFQIGFNSLLETPGQDFGERRMIAIRRDETELVASKSRQVSLAGERSQLLRQPAKHIVADRMAKHIVDLFEGIEVDTQNSECFFIHLCGIYRAGEIFHEGGPIWQICQ